MARNIAYELGGAEILYVGDGFACFKYAGKPEFVARLPFINNSFAVITKYRGGGMTFEKMVRGAAKKTFRQAVDGRSFRVRFSMENQFVKVPVNVLEMAEWAISKNCEMGVDRMRPGCEFWFIIRRDGPAYFGQLLTKRHDKRGGAALNSGELRPELACLLCLDHVFDASTVVCDPYAGYGAIPLHIQRQCKYKTMYVNDRDAGLVGRLKKTALGRGSGVVITCGDAVDLRHIAAGSVDLVVTDPPWGYVGKYGDIPDFYRRALAELKRIVKEEGEIVLLTGIPAVLTGAAKHSKLKVRSRRNILVNGKKAAVFTLHK